MSDPKYGERVIIHLDVTDRLGLGLDGHILSIDERGIHILRSVNPENRAYVKWEKILWLEILAEDQRPKERGGDESLRD